MVKKEQFIDLRSDTVTLPTDEMLEAIKHAELGDDVFDEDPTVNRLQQMAAEKMGKEAALLVASGTQANLVALMSNATRGDMVILEAESHIYWYEVGGLSAIGGLLPWPIKGNHGALNPIDIRAALKTKDIHFPETALVCIENTHNRAGGIIIPPHKIKAISEVVHSSGLRLYMDGARIFNAAVAMKTDVREFAKYVDSLMFCLSKGLSCPIGSIVVGSHEFIEKAKKIRKVLGGGMRQAGIIAASGIIALEKMIDRLKEDHANARLLAEKIAKTEGISIDPTNIQTNILHFNVSCVGMTSGQFVSKLKEKHLLALTRDEKTVRMVTHRGIEREHIEEAVAAVENVVGEILKQRKNA